MMVSTGGEGDDILWMKNAILPRSWHHLPNVAVFTTKCTTPPRTQNHLTAIFQVCLDQPTIHNGLQENTWRLARPHALPGQSIDVKTSTCRALRWQSPQLRVRTLKKPTNTVGNTNRRMQKIENITKNVAKTPFYILCTAAPRYVSLHLTE